MNNLAHIRSITSGLTTPNDICVVDNIAYITDATSIIRMDLRDESYTSVTVAETTNCVMYVNGELYVGNISNSDGYVRIYDAVTLSYRGRILINSGAKCYGMCLYKHWLYIATYGGYTKLNTLTRSKSSVSIGAFTMTDIWVNSDYVALSIAGSATSVRLYDHFNHSIVTASPTERCFSVFGLDSVVYAGCQGATIGKLYVYNLRDLSELDSTDETGSSDLNDVDRVRVYNGVLYVVEKAAGQIDLYAPYVVDVDYADYDGLLGSKIIIDKDSVVIGATASTNTHGIYKDKPVSYPKMLVKD